MKITLDYLKSTDACEEGFEWFTKNYPSLEADLFDFLQKMIKENQIDWMIRTVYQLGYNNLIHEFGCRCADKVLNKVKNPDIRSINGIIAKRKFLNGEINEEELKIAKENAHKVVEETTSHIEKYAALTADEACELLSNSSKMVTELTSCNAGSVRFAASNARFFTIFFENYSERDRRILWETEKQLQCQELFNIIKENVKEL